MLAELSHHLWKLLDPQVEGLPDQGKDQKMTPPKDATHTAAAESGKKRPLESSNSQDESALPKARMCIVCKTRHEPRCEIPASFRREQREKKRAIQNAAKGRGKGGNKSKSQSKDSAADGGRTKEYRDSSLRPTWAMGREGAPNEATAFFRREKEPGLESRGTCVEA